MGTKSINRLLLEQAVPASIGILILSIYLIVDTIYVGRFVGSLGIAAITVVMPFTFLISSLGMAIGVGGASIISRALGNQNESKAFRTFGNQIVLSLLLTFVFIFFGYLFREPILRIFGANGEIMPFALAYFNTLIIGVPALMWAMMSNNVIRAEGRPKVSMFVMIVPAILNIILDPIFIVYFDMGIQGAALATTIAYFGSGGFALLFFLSGQSEMKITKADLRLDFSLVREIAAIGGVTLGRQASISLLAIVLNNSLYQYGDELAVSTYGIINRISLFMLFPVMGLTQGFLPIAGFNYGAEKWSRVREVIRTSMLYSTGVSALAFLVVMLTATYIVGVFTTEEALMNSTPTALRWVFLALPLVGIQLIGSAYFQAIGKALPALLLTMTKQGFILVPLVFILPKFFGLDGIWYAFPAADLTATFITYIFLRRELKKNLPQQ